MKLINSRFYFDYNATSPLAPSVKEWISKGDLLFANPSSVHSSGKKTKRFLNQTREFLFELFSLKDYQLFFHSGASEGINTLVKGHAQSAFKEGERIHFIFSSSDHSAVANLKEELELYGHKVHTFDPKENGDFPYEKVATLLNSLDGQKLLNYTWVNNESGVVWPLEDVIKLKQETGCKVHVDAVQAVGKIEQWTNVSSELDSYTFSGHKFGAMKGVGFSFVKQSYKFCPMVRGGGQQDALRSGTENTTAIYTIKLALEDLVSSFDFNSLNDAKTYIENEIENLNGKNISIVASNATNRNGNTIYILIDGKKADITMTAFDLAQMDVSSGSACSSGSIKASRVMSAMGFNEDQSKSGIRLSFSHNLNMEDARTYSEKICKILRRFIS